MLNDLSGCFFENLLSFSWLKATKDYETEVKQNSPNFFFIQSKITSEPTPPNIHGVVVQICMKYFPTGSLQITYYEYAEKKKCNKNPRVSV